MHVLPACVRNFASNIRATAHCTHICFLQRQQFAVVVADYETTNTVFLDIARNYCHYIGQIDKRGPVERVCKHDESHSLLSSIKCWYRASLDNACTH